MRSILLFTAFLLLSSGQLPAQAISINTDGSNPDPSAILDVKSADKGMLVPRMSTGQRTGIGAPAAGLLVFDTGTGSFWLYNGTAWTNLAAPNRIADADNDTRVQVEESPDEDVIRFDVGGTEALVVDSARNVGIGTAAPVEKLDVAGSIKIGNTGTPAPAPGTIRWNEAAGDFEGFTGSQWKSLTKGQTLGGAWGVVVSYENEYSNADGFEQQTDAFFGYSVAISGVYAIVGAWGKDVSGKVNQGTAYIFVRGGNTAWTQQAILTASDGDSGDEFGFSVGISGDYAIVGAPGKRIAGSKVREGKAYIFLRSGASWTQQAILTAADGSAGDEVSYSVAISGNYAILGAYKKDIAGNVDQGKAYVFVRSGTTWSQQAALTASDGAAQDFFGSSVAISGDYAIVGAYGKTVNGNNTQGKAYIFLRSGASWSEQAILTASNGATTDLFGNGVAISDDYAVVGAPGKDFAGGHLDVGAAYVFVRSGATWSEQAILTASDGKFARKFGTVVAISGDYVCIGAANIGSNRAYVFGHSGMTWSQIAILAASDTVPSDKFGSGVGISGNHILVGDVLKDGLGANVGAVYFFSR